MLTAYNQSAAGQHKTGELYHPYRNQPPVYTDNQQPYLSTQHTAKEKSESAWMNIIPLFSYSIISIIGASLNICVLVYICVRRLWRNFVSSHFIAHLMLTNLIAFFVCIAIFIANRYLDESVWPIYPDANHTAINSSIYCRLQAFATCSIWMVMNYMALCIAGVHLLTFARIHYDQLFGLRPGVICCIAWLIAMGLGLPCITNSEIVEYNEDIYYCTYAITLSGYKFYTYLILLGWFLPSMLTWYAYTRILMIIYHSPAVFQALGLYNSRWLCLCFIVTPFCQLPFYIARLGDRHEEGAEPWWPAGLYEASFFLTFAACFISPLAYGASLFIMKEEDLSIMNRTNANVRQTYHPAGVIPQQL